MDQKIKRGAELGKNIKSLRLETGFGVTELSVRMQLSGCDITRESLNKIEAGKQNITSTQLRCFVQTFGISYNEFFRFLEEEHHG